MTRGATRSARDTRVWKFGGTSVADPTRLRAVAARVAAEHRAGRRMVIVLSAMGTATDDLLALAAQISPAGAGRELDALLATGEAVSCALAARALHDIGVPAISLNGGQAGFRTNGIHGNASLRELDPAAVLAALDRGSVVVVTGFQGIAPDGSVTTLGRGGSDASAIALAAALGLGSCEVWTDVDGIYTCDPRKVREARRLAEIGSDAMLALAFGGAGVMQPRAVGLAQRYGIDVHVRSSFTGRPGTWIRNEVQLMEQESVVGVALREYDPVYLADGLCVMQLCDALADAGVGIAQLTDAGDGRVRFSAPGAERGSVSAVLAGSGCRIQVLQRGSVTVVPTASADRSRLALTALRTLRDGEIEPDMVSSTPHSLVLHVPVGAALQAACLLHDTFVTDAANLVRHPEFGQVSDVA